MEFTKMHGLGNEFVVVANHNGVPENVSKRAIDICNRNFGVGADGLVFILPSDTADIRMRIFNADGTEAGLYRKMHIPDDPGYYEKYYFTPGDLGFKTFQTSFCRLGVLICWDQWFPEAVRITALQGAEVIFYPTAIGWHPEEKERYGEKQLDAWMTVQRGHAVANGLFIASANRVGFEQPFNNCKGIEFWGSSFICGPQGEILARASHDKEEILFAMIDIPYLENIRQNWPFFRDRRIDAFGDILKRVVD